MWWLVYQSLPHVAHYLTYSLFGLSEGSHLAAAVEFFIYDAPKVLMLLAIVVFGVGSSTHFSRRSARADILAGKKESVGNVLAACWGSHPVRSCRRSRSSSTS